MTWPTSPTGSAVITVAVESGGISTTVNTMSFDRDTITVIKVSGEQRLIRTCDCEQVTPWVRQWHAPTIVAWSVKAKIFQGLGFYPCLGEVYRHKERPFWFVEARYVPGSKNPQTGGPNQPLYVEVSREDMLELCDAASLDHETRELILGGSPQPEVLPAAEEAAPVARPEGLRGPRSIDFAAVASALRKTRKPMQAALVEYMADKPEAMADDIAQHVHGDSEASEGTLRNNANRTTTSLENMGIPLGFRLAAGRMFRDISPE